MDTIDLEKLMARLDMYTVIGPSGCDLQTGTIVTIDEATGTVVPGTAGDTEIGWMSENVGAGVLLVLDAETGEVFNGLMNEEE